MIVTELNPAWEEVSRFQKLGLKELQTKYQELFGKPTQSRNRKQLFIQLSKKLQEGAESEKVKSPSSSGLTAEFKPKRKPGHRKEETKKTTSVKKPRARAVGATDPRLPKPGTTVTKTYKGKVLNVRVTTNGFEYEGKSYRSLSAIAKKVTGSIWNGFLFFGLTKRQAKKG